MSNKKQKKNDVPDWEQFDIACHRQDLTAIKEMVQYVQTTSSRNRPKQVTVYYLEFTFAKSTGNFPQISNNQTNNYPGHNNQGYDYNNNPNNNVYHIDNRNDNNMSVYFFYSVCQKEQT